MKFDKSLLPHSLSLVLILILFIGSFIIGLGSHFKAAMEFFFILAGFILIVDYLLRLGDIYDKWKNK